MRLRGILLVVFLLMATLAAPAASAAVFDLHLLTDSSRYEWGDTARATLYTFKAGARWDLVELPTLEVSGFANRFTVNMSRSSTGIYVVDIALNRDMIGNDVTLALIGLRATAKDTSFVQSVNLWFTVGGTDTALYLRLSDYFPAVGAEVRVDMAVYRGGRLADPDQAVLNATIYNVGFLPGMKAIPVTRLGIGNYTGTFVVPAEWATARIFFVGGAAWSDASASGVAVAVVEGFSLWYHRLEMNRTTVRFELLAGDRDGQPAAGATMNLQWNGGPRLEGTTDANGAVSFSAPAVGSTMYQIRGNITYRGVEQPFMASFSAPDWLYVRPLVAEPDQFLLRPGQDVSLPYEATLMGEILPHATLTYVLRTSRAVVSFGSVVTDAQGRFFLNITAPDRSMLLRVAYEEPSSGGTYRMNTWVFVEQEDLRIEVDRLEIGSPIEVRLIADRSFGYVPIGPVFFVAPVDRAGVNFEWVPLTPNDYYLFYGVPTWTAEGFAVNVHLPATLPADREYIVLAFLATDLSETTAVYLRPGEGTGTDDGTGSTPTDPELTFLGLPLYGWLIVASVAAAVAAVILLRRRRGRMKAVETPPSNQEDAPATDTPP